MQKKLPSDKTSLEAQWETKKGAARLLGGAFDSWGGKVSGLLHQESSAGALDLTGDLAVKMGCKTCHATRKNLATLGGEFLEEVGILEINGLGGDVEPTARHAAICAAEIGAALWCLGYAHGVSVLILKRELPVIWSPDGGCDGEDSDYTFSSQGAPGCGGSSCCGSWCTGKRPFLRQPLRCIQE